MPDLPSAPDKSSNELSKLEEFLVSMLAKGKRPPEIARLVYPDDKVKRKNLRSKLWYMIKRDPRVANAVAEQARAELVLGLGPASQRLAKRAARLGKPQETKLLYEATGFHNPRVKHEHTGDIKISLDMPRPQKVSGVDDEVVDAEVVEE